MNKTPKLRFKEFSGDWEEKKLGNVAQIVGGGTPSTTESEYWNGNIPWFTPTEIKLQKFVSMSDRTITEVGLKKSSAKILPKGTVLLTTRASLGDMAIASQEVTTNQGFQSIIVGDDINNEFIYYLQPKLKKYCYKNASGSTFLEISKSNIEQFKFKMPLKEEQEKIATFCSLIDDKISLQGEKVEALKDYKSGMMQKIFSRELRFKDDDGRDYPEWEEKKLGEVCNITMGQSPSSSCYNEDEIGLPLIQGNADVKNRKTSPRIYTSEITKTCDIGDIIMSVRAPVGAISKSLHNACIGRGVCSIKPNQNKEYIYQFLLKSEDKWSKISQGSTFESVNSTDIKGLNILIPNLGEQEKIAKFLCDIDLKVEKEQDKLDSLNEYKKGLLQQMFV